jgi:outer membrane immunogenic protein
MKNLASLGFLATVTMTGASFAADVPVSAPYRPASFIPQQAVGWTGFYFGANAGSGWGQQSSDIRFTGNNGFLTNPFFGALPVSTTTSGVATTGGVSPTDAVAATGGVSATGGASAIPVSFGIIPGPTELSGARLRGSGSVSGAIAGGQIGFNWQAGMFVFGAEVDDQWSGQKSTFTVGCGAGCTTANFSPLSGSTLGWTAGAGVEIALWSNWSAKFEYLYVSANGATVAAPIPNADSRQPRWNIETISFASASTIDSVLAAVPGC